MQDFKNLQVWQRAHALALDVYVKTASFPKNELYGLVSQLRRAAVSIPSNIAEGSSRSGDKEFAQFLRYGAGSASEIEYLAILVADLAYLERSAAAKMAGQAVEVRRMLSGLLSTLTTSS
jgi:four helix bundle protein